MSALFLCVDFIVYWQTFVAQCAMSYAAVQLPIQASLLTRCRHNVKIFNRLPTTQTISSSTVALATSPTLAHTPLYARLNLGHTLTCGWLGLLLSVQNPQHDLSDDEREEASPPGTARHRAQSPAWCSQSGACASPGSPERQFGGQPREPSSNWPLNAYTMPTPQRDTYEDPVGLFCELDLRMFSVVQDFPELWQTAEVSFASG